MGEEAGVGAGEVPAEGECDGFGDHGDEDEFPLARGLLDVGELLGDGVAESGEVVAVEIGQ
ncbi:hypothetical protein ACFQV2_31580 [Actinokineospora soli]|uniref:Uncharacterized protein n=1 Tax=Actinokineospora soli TaxID=1048753 RepID=A0ABW2TVH1_9PSEU